MTKRVYPVQRREPSIHDPKYSAASPIAIPNLIDLRQYASPVLDQGQTSACTSFAISGVCEYLENLESEKFVPLSQLFVYNSERQNEKDFNTDGGAIIADGVAIVCSTGICEESYLPFAESNLYVHPDQAALDNAKLHKGVQGHSVSLVESNILHSLASNLPVIIGLTLYESFESDQVANTGIVPMPDVQSEQMLGGHAIAIYGADRTKRLYLIKNSWSTSWGDKGYCWVPFEYVQNPLLGNDYWAISKIS